MSKLSPTVQETVKNHSLDLIAVSIAQSGGIAAARPSAAKALALFKVRAAIEARLTDPALDATTVANAAGISIRYANALLSQEGTSVGRLVQAQRLARCQRALQDPLQDHRTVSEIAYGWGFSDMTHFGRSFKKAYGLLPSDYRRHVKRIADRI